MNARALEIILIFYEAPLRLFYVHYGCNLASSIISHGKLRPYTAARETDMVTAVYDIQSYFIFNIISASASLFCDIEYLFLLRQ